MFLKSYTINMLHEILLGLLSMVQVLDFSFLPSPFENHYFSLKAPYYNHGNILQVHYIGANFSASKILLQVPESTLKNPTPQFFLSCQMINIWFTKDIMNEDLVNIWSWLQHHWKKRQVLQLFKITWVRETSLECLGTFWLTQLTW